MEVFTWELIKLHREFEAWDGTGEFVPSNPEIYIADDLTTGIDVNTIGAAADAVAPFEAIGMQILAVSERSMSARIPLAALGDLAALPETGSVYLVSLTAVTPGPITPDIDDPPPRFTRDDLIAAYGEDRRGPLSVLGWDLNLLYHEFVMPGQGGFQQSNDMLPVQEGRVLLDIGTLGDASKSLESLKAIGMEVTSVSQDHLSGTLPIDALDDLAALTDVIRTVHPVIRWTNVGSTTTQGDVAQKSDASPEGELPFFGDFGDVPEGGFSDLPYLGDLGDYPINGHEPGSVVPGVVAVSLVTDEPIADLGAHVATLPWPDPIGPVTAADVHEFARYAVDGGFRTSFLLYLADGLSVDNAIALLEPLDFVAEVTPDYYLQLDRPPAAQDGDDVPGVVVVCLPSTERIDDIGAYVATLEWPDVLGTFDANNAERLSSFATADGFRTMVRLRIPDGVSNETAIAELEKTSFVESARSESWLDMDEWTVPGVALVTLRTRTSTTGLKLDDLDEFLKSQAWPDAIGPVSVDNVREIGSHGKEGGWVETSLLIYPSANVSVFDAVAELSEMNSVIESTRDSWLELEFTPNDTLYADQYHHPLMENDTAWDTTLGDSDIVVAVIDNGVDMDHPDLDGNIDSVNAWDFENGDSDPNPDAGEHHGTHVAGIVAAETNNGIGVAGTAGGVTILPYRGPTRGSRDSAINEAVTDGAEIVTISMTVDSTDVNSAAYRNAVDALENAGILHFNSAGNANQLNPVRQQVGNTLYVAATDDSDERYYTDATHASNYGTGIDISAPGVSILSTGIGSYGEMTGTSMAAPNAAGVAALIWSEHPTWTAPKVAAQLLGTADNIDSENPNYVGLLGSGRVNSNEALSGTLAPPTIDGLTEIPDGDFPRVSSLSELTVELASVFDETSIETAANWDLRSDGADGVFGTGDDSIRGLTLETEYGVATNDLVFSFSSLPKERYRFTAFSGGLEDPFETSLDGNADETAGDDFVKEFYVGSTMDLVIDATLDPAAGNQKGDGYADSFVLSRTGDSLQFVVNGSTLSLVPMTEISSVLVDGSSDVDTVTVNGLGNFQPSVTVNAGTGTDTAYLYGSTGDDTLTAAPGDVLLEIEDAYSVQVDDSETVKVYATAGGNDTTTFSGSSQNEAFVAWSDGEQMVTAGYTNEAWYFDSGTVNSISGGWDVAKIYDTPGDDLFVCDDETATWTPAAGNGYLSLTMNDFDQNVAYATNGGTDTATFTGNSDKDNFAGFYMAKEGSATTPGVGNMWGTGYNHYVKFFDSLVATAVTGGVDTASFYDSTGDDLYMAYPTYVTHRFGSTGSASLRANNFLLGGAHAFAGAGGDDTAHFYGDSGNGDTFIRETVTLEQGASGVNSLGTMLRSGVYWNRAKYYENVYGHFSTGGNDLAIFKDSPEDDTGIYDANEFEFFNALSRASATIFAEVDGLGSGDEVQLENIYGNDNDDSTTILSTPLYTYLDVREW